MELNSLKAIEREVQVGIVDKDTKELIKIYPERVKGDFNEIKEAVMTWYYKQGCENEDKMRNYTVDIID